MNYRYCLLFTLTIFCGLAATVSENEESIRCHQYLENNECSNTTIIGNLEVCGTTVCKRNLKVKRNLEVQGKFKVKKNARFEKNVVVSGILQAEYLKIVNCIDSLCVKSLSVTDLIIGGSSCIDNLCVNNLSVNNQTIDGNVIISGFTSSGIVHNDSSGLLSSSLIVNADVDPAAGIVDTKLATISTAGKVANSATTATTNNISQTIVSRDGLGSFSTTMITITGPVTNPTDVATKAYVDAAIIPAIGTPLNIPNSLVQRDNTGSFAAQTISSVDNILTGNISLNDSTSISNGNIIKNGIHFIHNFGTNNTFIGKNAGNFTTSGIGRNSALGVGALSGITNGANNIAIGYQAGQTLTTGSGNIYINANAVTANENSIIRIGTSQTQCFMAGIAGVGVSGDVVVIDTAGKLGITLSSQRFKHNIQDMNDNSEVIYQLRPVTFVYDNDTTETTQYGLIAEEVDTVFSDIVSKNEEGIAYTVRYHMLPILLLNELQKQRKCIIEQQKAIDQLDAYKIEIENLKKSLSTLQKAFDQLIHKTIE